MTVTPMPLPTFTLIEVTVLATDPAGDITVTRKLDNFDMELHGVKPGSSYRFVHDGEVLVGTVISTRPIREGC